MSLLCICCALVSPALLGSLPTGCCSPWLCAPDSFVFFFQGPALSQISVFWSQHCQNSLVKTTLSLGLGVRSPSQPQSSSHAGELTSYPGHSFIPPVFPLLCFCQSDEWWLHRVTFHRCTKGPQVLMSHSTNISLFSLNFITTVPKPPHETKAWQGGVRLKAEGNY